METQTLEYVENLCRYNVIRARSQSAANNVFMHTNKEYSLGLTLTRLTNHPQLFY